MDFNEIVERRCEKIRKVLTAKAKEYATDINRFHNFEVAGRIDGETPEKALWGMFKKHLVSVMDLIDWCEGKENKITEYLIDEKIGDAINYLILLEGMLQRRVYRRQDEPNFGPGKRLHTGLGLTQKRFGVYQSGMDKGPTL